MKKLGLGVLSLAGLLLAQTAAPSVPADDKPATVAGSRGLNEPTDAVDTTSRDDAAIDRLDKQTVTPDELNQFIKEGHLP